MGYIAAQLLSGRKSLAMEGNVSLAVQSGAIKFLKGLRPLFYVEPPSQSCFQRVEDVPKYLEKV